MLQLNNIVNSNGSNGGGGGGGGSSDVPKFSYYVDFANNNGTITLLPKSALKSTNNADYYISFLCKQENATYTMLEIGGVLKFGYLSGNGMCSYNYANQAGEVISDMPDAGRQEYKININGTKKTFYVRSGDTWESIYEQTDSGMNTDSDIINTVGSGAENTSDKSLNPIDFWSLKIDIGGTTVFDGKTAVRGTDYNTSGILPIITLF